MGKSRASGQKSTGRAGFTCVCLWAGVIVLIRACGFKPTNSITCVKAPTKERNTPVEQLQERLRDLIDLMITLKQRLHSLGTNYMSAERVGRVNGVDPVPALHKSSA